MQRLVRLAMDQRGVFEVIGNAGSKEVRQLWNCVLYIISDQAHDAALLRKCWRGIGWNLGSGRVEELRLVRDGAKGLAGFLARNKLCESVEALSTQAFRKLKVGEALCGFRVGSALQLRDGLFELRERDVFFGLRRRG